MKLFKQSNEYGYPVTIGCFKCKRCGQVDNMIKLITNFTPTTDQIVSERLNPAPDAVQFKEEFMTSDDYYNEENSGQPILLGVKYSVERTYYRWHFVQCPQCKSKHILEYKYDSEIDEEYTSFFPLF